MVQCLRLHERAISKLYENRKGRVTATEISKRLSVTEISLRAFLK
jgi:hypothetical protein